MNCIVDMVLLQQILGTNLESVPGSDVSNN